ncbi:hypothetical protein OPT61_g2478 [Boeremia exigua]|uniref:Uncharacterized protein n=1 Tax=Boeremia exigua TaxID=749465 RepID=A0ACC2ILD2_9PLEO|nr:hypothetical protein OPT61_g2478 [Boeremia exigua]
MAPSSPPPHSPKPPSPPSQPPMTVSEVIRRIAERPHPSFLRYYEGYPEWKLWALSGRLEELAKAHQVEITFVVYPMPVPQKLFRAYVDTMMQDEDLTKAVDAHRRARVLLSNEEANGIMAMIEGWDEEESDSDGEAVSPP